MTIIIRFVFSENDKFYPQLFSDDALYAMLRYQKIHVSEGIDVNKTSELKECKLWQYWFFKDVGFKFEKRV